MLEYFVLSQTFIVVCFLAVMFISLPGWSFWALFGWCAFCIVCLILANCRSLLLPFVVGVFRAESCNYSHRRWQIQVQRCNNFSCLIWSVHETKPLLWFGEGSCSVSGLLSRLYFPVHYTVWLQFVTCLWVSDTVIWIRLKTLAWTGHLTHFLRQQSVISWTFHLHSFLFFTHLLR